MYFLSFIIKYFLKNHYLRYSEYYKDILWYGQLLKNLEVSLSWLLASPFLVYFLPIMKLFLLITKLWHHQWLILLHLSGWFPIENWVVLPMLTFHTSQDNQPGPPRGLHHALLCFFILSRFYFSSLAFVYYLYSVWLPVCNEYKSMQGAWAALTGWYKDSPGQS